MPRNIIYILLQYTWALPQTLIGFFKYLKFRKCKDSKRFFYNGAIVTQEKSIISVSLGDFIFLTDDDDFFSDSSKKLCTINELYDRLLVHEFGHTIQSLILGPLYLPVIGISSFIWCFAPYYKNKRKKENLSYYNFWCEKWANKLGEAYLKRISMRDLHINV